MKSVNRIIAQKIALAAVVAVAMANSKPAAAAETELTLLGHRWEKPVVTYWVNTGGGVSDAAILDVLTAIGDWNAALEGVPNAPAFAAASNRKKADILIDLKVRTTRNVFGGDHPLAGGYGALPEITSGCVLQGLHLSLQGSLLGDTVGHARTRNLTRHILGNALGLGEIYCPGDLMDAQSQLIEVDLDISACDLAGIAAIYTAPSCDQIPASIECTCQ